MSLKDLSTFLKSLVSIVPQAAAATVTGAVVSLAAGESQMALVAIGLNSAGSLDASNLFTFKVQVGNLSNGTDMADVAAADYFNVVDETNVAWDKLIDEAGELSLSYKMGFINSGNKLYARVVATKTGTTTVGMSACILQGGLKRNPS